MNHRIIIPVAIALVLSAKLVIAGSVTDTYVSGDILTTTILKNIKSAVNDNNNYPRFYGDGSAGVLNVSGVVDWRLGAPSGNNLNFTDIVISTGGTLKVSAGTTIRCTGTFINEGTLLVQSQTNFGSFAHTTNAWNRIDPAGKGDALTAASTPEGHTALGVLLLAGIGGRGLPRATAASSFSHFRSGGGAGSPNLFGSSGARGGGLVKIYCKGDITNNGVINADGETSGISSGGGGGGIVILASSNTIRNVIGSITANGGAGTNAGTNVGASGGGGGGMVIMVAPAITNLGNTSVAGGAAGQGGATITSALHAAGGGGGASGGNGGLGGHIDSTDITFDATSGSIGHAIEISANPAHMIN